MSPTTELEALLALRLLPGVGDLIVIRALLRQGSALDAWARPGAVRARGNAETAAALARPDALLRRVRRILRTCRERRIGTLGYLDSDYPRDLRHLHDPPPILFWVGDLSLLSRPIVAVVGARRATATGRRTAERFARAVSDRGMCVVSGLALGIDGAAHRGAIRGPGRTIAVLGRGPERAYPVANADLFRAIAREGLLLSEFPPGEKARPYHFPRRNRVIAALGWGVLVVEAGKRSGALITVDHALDLGREVMAVPGSVEWEQTRGTHDLIRRLGCIVTTPEELLQKVPWASLELEKIPDGLREFRDAAGLAFPRPADRAEETLDDLVGVKPLPLEVILEKAGLPPSRTLAALTRLEVEGRLRRDPEGWVRAPG